MIKIALPNKGQLMPPAIDLLTSSGYRAEKPSRSLSSLDVEHDIEFFFLRPGDIPHYVSSGILDAGITGADFVAESGLKANRMLDLGFGHSRHCAAVPADQEIEHLQELASLRIATSFPGIVRSGIPGVKHIVELEGAVEISVKLGIADAIVDVVATGTTIRQAGLKIIDKPLFHSEAALFTNPGKEESTPLKILEQRLRGKITAREYRMIEYDTPANLLETVCQLTPGIESPTVAPLRSPNWFSVKSMVKLTESHGIMDQLSEMGCKGILLSKIESMRN